VDSKKNYSVEEMPRESNIIRMAREATSDIKDEFGNWLGSELDKQKFAVLVAAHEREECAKVCEDSDTWDLYDPNGFAANLIRARGEK
jgi:hypothetical protein